MEPEGHRLQRAGLGYASWRAESPDALQQAGGVAGGKRPRGNWVDPEFGTGPSYSFLDPDGHAFRLYYGAPKGTSAGGKGPGASDQLPVLRRAGRQRALPDHVNLLARDVRRCREFWEQGFGLRTYEIIRQPDTVPEAGAWMSSSIQGHELIYTQEKTSGNGRLRSFAYLVDSREEVLRAAGIFADARVPIKAGPSQHTAIQGFYLYTREPGGNRIEVANGGYLMFAPDQEPSASGQPRSGPPSQAGALRSRQDSTSMAPPMSPRACRRHWAVDVEEVHRGVVLACACRGGAAAAISHGRGRHPVGTQGLAGGARRRAAAESRIRPA